MSMQPTEVMIFIAERHAQRAMAEIGREVIKGAAGWAPPNDPLAMIQNAVLAALLDFEARVSK
jgi:hypothetical protein